jgi:hypothetical protein
MRKSGQFWQDVDLAICTLMLRQLLNQIITEGRNTGLSFKEINKTAPSLPGRDRVLYHYHEVMTARLRHYNGQLYA